MVQCATLPTFPEVVFHVLHPIVSTKRPSASPASGGKGRRRVVTSVRSRPGDAGAPSAAAAGVTGDTDGSHS